VAGVHEGGCVSMDGRGLGPRVDVGTTCGTNTMLNVRSGDRICMIELDVEDYWDNIEVKP
jgi:hypothetical protein